MTANPVRFLILPMMIQSLKIYVRFTASKRKPAFTLSEIALDELHDIHISTTNLHSGEYSIA
jgi:hypothetical protein